MLTIRFKKWTSVATLALMSAGMLASCTAPNADQAATSDSAATTEGSEVAMCAPELAEIEFGIISTESADNLKPQWEPFLEAMSEELGRPVIGFYATDYAGVIEAMGAGKIQIAWYGGKSYIEAAARSDAEAFAQTVATDGSMGYYAYLITNKENPIVGDIDLEAGNGDQYVIENSKDLTFAFNDPNSTSGYLVPTYYVFAQNGINPNTAFEQLIFSGSHEATALAVAENQVDIATNNSENLARLEETAPDALEKIQIIWTSPIIPGDPLAYRNDLPDCMKEAIQNFAYNYDDAEVLNGLGWSKLVPAGDEGWYTIRELDFAEKILTIQNDTNLSEADKAAQIEPLQAQLDALK